MGLWPGGAGEAKPRPLLRPSGTGRSGRRSVLLALGGVLVCLVAFLVVVLLTSGAEGLLRLFTEPSLEARSGRKYTPAGAVKRYVEKLDESPPPEAP